MCKRITNQKAFNKSKNKKLVWKNGQQKCVVFSKFPYEMVHKTDDGTLERETVNA